MVNRIIDSFFHWMSEVVSSKKLFLWIFFFTAIWIIWNWVGPYPLDKIQDGLPYLILVYTIYFAWVEGIMKVVQRIQQHAEEKRQIALDAIIEQTNANTEQIKVQTKVIHNLVKIQLALGKKTLELLEAKRKEPTNVNKCGNPEKGFEAIRKIDKADS